MKKLLTIFVLLFSVTTSGPVLGMKRKRSPEGDEKLRPSKKRRKVRSGFVSNGLSDDGSSSEEEFFIVRRRKKEPKVWKLYCFRCGYRDTDYQRFMNHVHYQGVVEKKKGKRSFSKYDKYKEDEEDHDEEIAQELPLKKKKRKKRKSKYDKFKGKGGEYRCPDCKYVCENYGTFVSHANRQGHAGQQKTEEKEVEREATYISLEDFFYSSSSDKDQLYLPDTVGLTLLARAYEGKDNKNVLVVDDYKKLDDLLKKKPEMEEAGAFRVKIAKDHWVTLAIDDEAGRDQIVIFDAQGHRTDQLYLLRLAMAIRRVYGFFKRSLS